MMDKESRQIKKEIRKSENSIILTVLKISLILIAIGVQIFIFYTFIATTHHVYNSSVIIYNVFRFIGILYLIYRHDTSAYKMAWMLFIFFAPSFGLCVYFLWGNNRIRRRKQLEIIEIENKTNYLFEDSFEIENEIKEKDFLVYNQLKYIKNITSYPATYNQGIKYYNLGDKLFEDLKKDILNATKYIFMEYYIISSGKLTSEIFSILKEKAKAGIEVIIIYDSLGCLGKFDKKTKIDLENSGIKTYSFNPPSVLINSYINNRMHRKIMVIDGEIAYTGGINLADEYANIKELYGHWKDSGIRVVGNSAWNFTLMFLRDLKFLDKKINIDFEKYKIKTNIKKESGFIVSFSDGPNNRKNPVESVYMQTIQTSKEYVYITTPYFAISESMLASILNTARSGVDVRIILPHIPDKKIVQMSTRSYYEVLLIAGVKVYEYKPGFIHSKSIVSDDKLAIIGTSNMDFRSMNLNYECISMIYETGSEIEVKKDFLDMIENSCIEIEFKNWIKRPMYKKLVESILTAFLAMF